MAACTNCGAAARVDIARSEDTEAMLQNPHFVFIECESCGDATSAAYLGVLLNLPAVRQFWSERRRIRRLHQREVEAAGVAAIVTRFESLSDSALLDVVSTRDTLELVGIYGAPGLTER